MRGEGAGRRIWVGTKRGKEGKGGKERKGMGTHTLVFAYIP